jgi:hypothetical protein
VLQNTDLRVSDRFFAAGPLVSSDQFCQDPFERLQNVKERLLLNAEDLTAFGGGHTLRSNDLGMILAWRGNGVSDGAHSAHVMKAEQTADLPADLSRFRRALAALRTWFGPLRTLVDDGSE